MSVTSAGATAFFDLLEHRQLLAQTPFSGSPLQIPGTIQVEDFDWGGEGVAYHDTTVENLGGSDYHGSTSVDLHATLDAGGTQQVGYIKASEWLEYTVTVQQTGMY